MRYARKGQAVSTEFKGEIHVAARVIDFLSSGLYQNAASCLKELINNSYDADARHVLVSVKPEADLIIIEDDGVGMSRDQFETHFQNVAESHKRDDGQTTPGGRMKIGKIGIGFIAANELCDEMELYSTRRGSAELLHVTINFGEIRERSFSQRREPAGQVKKGDYIGEILEAGVDESYTQVYLKEIRPSAREQFVRDTIAGGGEPAPSIYGLKPESVTKLLAGLDSWGELDLYSQTRLHVGLNVPVAYLPEWAPEEYLPELGSITRRAEELGFAVTYDGTPLLKPTVLTDPKGRSILRTLHHEGEHISVTGYLFARHGAYKPKELNGLLIRIRESAVGDYDGTWLNYPPQLSPLFKDWSTCELHVEGTSQHPGVDLDDALNIERRTLRETHPATVELQEWFYSEFKSFLADVRQELYTAPSRERAGERAAKQRKRLADVADRAREAIGPEAAEAITDAFATPKRRSDVPSPSVNGEPHSSADDADPRVLLREYQAVQVYEAAVEAAAAVLPRELASAFLAELIRRLT